MKKKLSFIIPGLALALFLACPQAQAQPGAQDYQKLESLHDQLWVKQMELDALARAGNSKEVKAAADEMVKLRSQIRDERRRLGGPEWGPGGGPGPGAGGCPYYYGGHGHGHGWGHGRKGGRGWN